MHQAGLRSRACYSNSHSTLQGSSRQQHRSRGITYMQSSPAPRYLPWSAPLVWTEHGNQLPVPKKGFVKQKEFCSCDLLTTTLDHAAGFALSSVCVKTSPEKSWGFLRPRFLSKLILRKLQGQIPSHPERTWFAKFYFRVFLPPTVLSTPFVFISFLNSHMHLQDHQSGRKNIKLKAALWKISHI